MRPQLAKLLPKELPPERLIRVFLTEFQTNPTLAQCEQKSILACLLQCAQLGLEPGDGRGLVYLVPFKDKNCGLVATRMTGYRGLLKLSRQSGLVRRVWAEVVHEKDAFSYQMGTEPNIQHKPSLEPDTGKPTFVYAVAEFSDGGKQFVVLPNAEVAKVRNASRAKDSGPWQTWPEEMAKKTAVRRLYKLLPDDILPTLKDKEGKESVHAAEVLAREDQSEFGSAPEMDADSTVESTEPDPPPQDDGVSQITAADLRTRIQRAAKGKDPERVDSVLFQAGIEGTLNECQDVAILIAAAVAVESMK